jgi:hypothetical protein
MPSPFPGMDPYLEHPRLWPGVHANLILEFQAYLSDALDPRYLVDIEQRLYIVPADDTLPQLRHGIVPDAAIRRGTARAAASGLKVAVHSAPVQVVERASWTARESSLVITDPETGSEPVAVVELLSPGNKARGLGRRKYIRKRRLTLNSETHLVEIDLLRAGKPTMPLPDADPSDYRIYVSNARRRPRGDFGPVMLSQRLPTIPIPLLKNETVDLPLQTCLDNIYSRAKYASKLKYDTTPVPPLSPVQARWATKLLKGRR